MNLASQVRQTPCYKNLEVNSKLSGKLEARINDFKIGVSTIFHIYLFMLRVRIVFNNWSIENIGLASYKSYKHGNSTPKLTSLISSSLLSKYGVVESTVSHNVIHSADDFIWKLSTTMSRSALICFLNSDCVTGVRDYDEVTALPISWYWSLKRHTWIMR